MHNNVAVRERPLPRQLRDLAVEAGCTPEALLVQVLSEYPTNEEAARALRVGRNTLWRWCQRAGVTVEVIG